MSQHTTKPTVRPVWSAKTQISQYIHSVWQGFSFIPLLIAWKLLKAHALSKDWSDCKDAQADLNLCWSHKSYCRFCHALVQMKILALSGQYLFQYFVCKIATTTTKTNKKETTKKQIAQKKQRKKTFFHDFFVPFYIVLLTANIFMLPLP